MTKFKVSRAAFLRRCEGKIQVTRRAGRKRKAGRRASERETINDRAPDDRTRTMRQPHRRTLPTQLRGDERAESPLGRMALRRVIDDDQYDAGNLFSGAVGAYAATIGTPAAISGTLGHLVASNYPNDAEAVGSELSGGCAAEQSGAAEFCRDNPEQCDCLSRRRRYMRAYEALHVAVGHRGLLVVLRVVVHREDIAREDIVYLKRGLAALAAHFGLIAPRKRAE
jgi:hypothetical protein